MSKTKLPKTIDISAHIENFLSKRSNNHVLASGSQSK